MEPKTTPHMEMENEEMQFERVRGKQEDKNFSPEASTLLLKMFFKIGNVVQKALQVRNNSINPGKKTKAIELGTKANSNMSTLTFRACKSIHRKKVANLPSQSGSAAWSRLRHKKMSKTK